MTPQQKEVLILRFGLSGEYELTLVHISQCMGISRERVRQVEQQALTLLRRYGLTHTAIWLMLLNFERL